MQIKVELTRDFIKSVKKLPAPQLRKLSLLIEELQLNPFSSPLHTKLLTGNLAGFYSFRITRDWRVIFQFLDPTTIKLIDVAHRKEIYR